MSYFPLVNILDKKSLIWHFCITSIKLRYRGTYLGVLWSALEPLLMFVLLYVVFSSIRETNKEDFGIYLITGIMLYHLFVKGTMAGLGSIVNNSGLLKSFNLKKEFFPVVATGSTALLMFPTLIVFFGLMPIFDFYPTITILFLPIVIILLLVLILGISYFLSLINVLVRDIQQFWGIFSYALIFVTPIFWYVEDIDGILATIHKVNPLGQVVELAHMIVFNQIPSFEQWIYASTLVFAIFIVGFVFFQKFESKIIEKL